MDLFKTRILPLLLLVLMCSSCTKDDDISLTGEMNVSFYNVTSGLAFRIFTLDNEQIPILDITYSASENSKIPMNPGNYVIKPYSSSIYYESIGFQVLPGRTTTIVYDDHNAGTVQL